MQMSLVPKKAATVVLVRSSPVSESPDGPIEVFLTRRPDSMIFAGGNFVFPGGKLDSSDYAPENLALVSGMQPADAARILGGGEPPERSLGFWLAAIRELFEEAGILLCITAEGQGPDLGVPAVQARLTAGRQGVHQRIYSLASLVRELGLRYDPSPLCYLMRWITPVYYPMRFDARYFLCEIPPGQVPTGCSREVSGVRWVAPGEALGRWRAGELKMREPTVTTLMYLARYPNCRSLFASVRNGDLLSQVSLR